jgi:hypothetical protein
MSAFGGKADVLELTGMSAYDPSRTLANKLAGIRTLQAATDPCCMQAAVGVACYLGSKSQLKWRAITRLVCDRPLLFEKRSVVA